jgi:hypothetical protein
MLILKRIRFDFLLRTPSVATMHQDASPDLQEVQKILSNVLGVWIKNELQLTAISIN